MRSEAGEDQSVDGLRRYGLRVIQPADGYRFSLDPLLLCDFASVPEGAKVVDLGTGSGIIPMVLARKRASASFLGVELQKEMAELAQRNLLLNDLAGQVEVVAADVLSLRERFPVSSFDLVVANPPYRKSGTGRVSPKTGRDVARHETTATLADFLETAKYLVRPGGRICFIYLAERLAEFLVLVESLKLAPLRLRMVHGAKDADARMFLIDLAKGRSGTLKIMAPLMVNGENSAYAIAPEDVAKTI